MTSILLQPGEEREVELCIGLGARIHGIVLDELGDPLPHRDVWLDHALGAVPPVRVPAPEWWNRPQTKTQTDEAGCFEFPSVLEGLWWVVADPGSDRVSWGEVLHITPASEEYEVRLRLEDGRTVRGCVVFPDGRQVPQATLNVFCTDPHLLIQYECASDGTFEIGPLPAVPLTLRAWPPSGGMDVMITPSSPEPAEYIEAFDVPAPFEADSVFDTTCSARVMATPEAEGIVLQLQPVGRIEGEVQGIEGRDVPTGHVQITECTRPEQVFDFGRYELEAGTFETFYSPPGTYQLLVSTDDQRIAVHTVEVRSGAATRVSLETEPAAVLRLNLDASLWPADIRLISTMGSIRLNEHWSDTCEGPRLIPPGSSTLEIRPLAKGGVITRTIHASPGETVRIDIPASPQDQRDDDR